MLYLLDGLLSALLARLSLPVCTHLANMRPSFNRLQKDRIIIIIVDTLSLNVQSLLLLLSQVVRDFSKRHVTLVNARESNVSSAVVE